MLKNIEIEKTILDCALQAFKKNVALPVETEIAGQQPDLKENADYLLDIDIQGQRLTFAADVKISDPATTGSIRKILTTETDDESRYRLIIDMVKAYRFRDSFGVILQHIKKLKEGFFRI
jgi:hypothetical protein